MSNGCTDAHHLLPILAPQPPILVQIFADLDGGLVGRTQTLIPEMSELNMAFSGLTAAWIYNKRPESSVARE